MANCRWMLPKAGWPSETPGEFLKNRFPGLTQSGWESRGGAELGLWKLSPLLSVILWFILAPWFSCYCLPFFFFFHFSAYQKVGRDRESILLPIRGKEGNGEVVKRQYVAWGEWWNGEEHSFHKYFLSACLTVLKVQTKDTELKRSITSQGAHSLGDGFTVVQWCVLSAW